MNRPLAEDLGDALGLLINDARESRDPQASMKRILRVVKRIEDAAFKRGAEAGRQGVIDDLRSVQAEWRRISDTGKTAL